MQMYSLLTRTTLTQRDHGRTNTMSCNEHSTYYINLSVIRAAIKTKQSVDSLWSLNMNGQWRRAGASHTAQQCAEALLRPAEARGQTCSRVITDGGEQRPFHTQQPGFMKHISTCHLTAGHSLWWGRDGGLNGWYLLVLMMQTLTHGHFCQQHTNKLKFVWIRESCLILFFFLWNNKKSSGQIIRFHEMWYQYSVCCIHWALLGKGEECCCCNWVYEVGTSSKKNFIELGPQQVWRRHKSYKPLSRPQHLPAWHDIKF